jgi:hypothetical protein|tara:strand:- start:745 stop:897 length:153 start_codon:yes stop_codon:yes gene_type:complete
MSIWEEHKDQIHFEQMDRQAECYLRNKINNAFCKVLAKELLKNRREQSNN